MSARRSCARRVRRASLGTPYHAGTPRCAALCAPQQSSMLPASLSTAAAAPMYMWVPRLGTCRTLPE
eukprot:1205288-Prymnesium_polylepis.1